MILTRRKSTVVDGSLKQKQLTSDLPMKDINRCLFVALIIHSVNSSSQFPHKDKFDDLTKA